VKLLDIVAHTDYTKYAELSSTEDLWNQRWGTFEKMSKDEARIDTFKKSWETIWLSCDTTDRYEAIRTIFFDIIRSEEDSNLKWRLESCMETVVVHHPEEHTRRYAASFFLEELRKYRGRCEQMIKMIQDGLEKSLSCQIDKDTIAEIAKTITTKLVQQTE
jgi:hypothetical protein